MLSFTAQFTTFRDYYLANEEKWIKYSDRYAGIFSVPRENEASWHF